MKRLGTPRAAVLALGALLATASGALADNTKEAAREFQAGLDANEAKNYQKAIVHFTRAYDLAPHPFALYNIALAYERLGQFRSAAHWYGEYLRAPGAPQGQEARDVQRAIMELAKKPSRVLVRTRPPGARVLVDGQPIGVAPIERLVYGGDHRVRAELEGESFEKQIHLEFGEPATVDLDLPTPPGGWRPRPTPQPDPPPVPMDPAHAPPVTFAPTPSQSATTGTLQITGTPMGALIAIDERVVGRVPATFFLEPGPHKIAISSLGYARYEVTTTVTKGALTPLEVKLRPGDTGETIDPNAPKAGGFAYWLGVAGGGDADGHGLCAAATIGFSYGRFSLGSRYTKIDSSSGFSVIARLALFNNSRITPFIGAGFGTSFESTSDMDGGTSVDMPQRSGAVLLGGLRFDLSKADTSRVSLIAESGGWYLGNENGAIVPFLVGIELMYGKLK